MKMKQLLQGSYVREDGKIYPWGMIRIYSNVVQDNPNDSYGGLACWSRKLMPYGDGKHYARIVGENIDVFSKETSEKIATISTKNIITSTGVDVARVREMGYLQVTGMLGMMFSRNDDWSSELNALRKASKKEPLPYRDNSAFVRVSEALTGKDLIQLDLGMGRNRKYKVFTFEGNPVKIKVSRPLRFDGNNPCKKTGHDTNADQGEYSCSLNITLAAL
jgi:hypothetical protein